MAEDLGDKTEAPTPRKRQEARQQGNVAKSRDIPAALLLLGVLVLLNWFGLGLMEAMRQVMERMLGAELSRADMGSLGSSIVASALAIAGAMAPFLIGVVVIVMVGNILQVGLLFTPKRLKPRFSTLSPLKGLKKIFGKGQAFVLLAMNLIKLVLIVLVAYSALHGRLEQIVMAQELAFTQVFGLAAEIIWSIGIRIGLLLLVLSLLDYAYQKWKTERELKMTKQQVKDEMRRMDGDPQIKQRRRQVARQLAEQRARMDVPRADVVVTNPTHFAVALRYDPDSMHAPKVVAKGQDYMAMRIREIAVLHGIPILERAPLARALYRMVEVGQEIPEEFYAAIAEILAYVYELTGKAKQGARSGMTAQPAGV
jgi:flagellar biosynthetic protein FlhB